MKIKYKKMIDGACPPTRAYEHDAGFGLTAVWRRLVPTNGHGYDVGARIGQLVIFDLPAVEMVQAHTLAESERGKNGYGSSDFILADGDECTG